MHIDVTNPSINLSQGGSSTPEENQKQSSDIEAGQLEPDVEVEGEAEAGIIDGETDAEVDL